MQIPRRIILGLAVTVVLALFLTVPGEKGLIKAYHLRQDLKALSTQNAELRRENAALAQEAHLLRENLPYLAHIITREMNMVRPGDTIVVIKKKTD